MNADGQTDITFPPGRPIAARLSRMDHLRPRFLCEGLLMAVSIRLSSFLVLPQIDSPVLKGMEMQTVVACYGSFNKVNGVPRPGVARLLANGTVDPTFVPDPSIIATGFARNFSTRLVLGTGEFVLIGGFIVDGTAPKKVMIRGIGPSLAPAGVATPSADPRLSLRDSGGAEIARNDNWRQTQIGESSQATRRARYKPAALRRK